MFNLTRIKTIVQGHNKKITNHAAFNDHCLLKSSPFFGLVLTFLPASMQIRQRLYSADPSLYFSQVAPTPTPQPITPTQVLLGRSQPFPLCPAFPLQPLSP